MIGQRTERGVTVGVNVLRRRGYANGEVSKAVCESGIGDFKRPSRGRVQRRKETVACGMCASRQQGLEIAVRNLERNRLRALPNVGDADVVDARRLIV